MLPEDTKKCKQVDKQPSVTEHFGPKDHDAKLIPYSDKALEIALLKWVIQTNQVFHLYYTAFLFPKLIPIMLQPILALKHAVLKNMLDIASRANPNQGIWLPLPKQSRARIITMFKQQLCSLQDRLNVSSLFLSIIFSHWYLVRVPLWLVKLAWRAMHGRLVSWMPSP